MKHVIFCTDCHTNVSMHADGTLSCSCSMVSDPDSDPIPAGWNTTREQCYELQLAESEEV